MLHKKQTKCFKGGVATCVREDLAINTLKVSEGSNNDEYIVTRHGQFDPAINDINLYGNQESRQSADQIKESWDKILEEMSRIEAKNENLVLLGDLNRHIGLAVENNHEKTTLGGKLLLSLLDNEEYVLVNALDKTKGGPFTRFDRRSPNDDSKKSLLDLVIVSRNLLRYVEKLEIDRNQGMDTM